MANDPTPFIRYMLAVILACVIRYGSGRSTYYVRADRQ